MGTFCSNRMNEFSTDCYCTDWRQKVNSAEVSGANIIDSARKSIRSNGFKWNRTWNICLTIDLLNKYRIIIGNIYSVCFFRFCSIDLHFSLARSDFFHVSSITIQIDFLSSRGNCLVWYICVKKLMTESVASSWFYALLLRLISIFFPQYCLE